MVEIGKVRLAYKSVMGYQILSMSFDRYVNVVSMKLFIY